MEVGRATMATAMSAPAVGGALVIPHGAPCRGCGGEAGAVSECGGDPHLQGGRLLPHLHRLPPPLLPILGTQLLTQARAQTSNYTNIHQHSREKKNPCNDQKLTRTFCNEQI